MVNIDVAEVKKVDDLTLTIPLKSPDARLYDQFVQQNTVIVQDGYTDYANPVGTGAFKFVSFTVGERSLCAKNADYWEEGKPYVDEWEDISISDNAARLNALLAGEIDMMSQLEFAQAKAQQEAGEIQVIDSPSPAIQVILMAVDEPPFDDPLVRQAFRLIPDREAMINAALGGFGTVGQRPRRRRPAVLRRPPRAGAGSRAGEVATPAGRSGGPQRHAADVDDRARASSRRRRSSPSRRRARA